MLDQQEQDLYRELVRLRESQRAESQRLKPVASLELPRTQALTLDELEALVLASDMIRLAHSLESDSGQGENI
ncbi:hypothetical protein HDU91_001160 [Kappamyces sp. JEL0680]|nr:hypothetical protein HDU91_001160 [Kappamyces sp. JEL0680]